MNDYYHKTVNKFQPDFKDVGCFFKEYLKKYIKPDSNILDVGCGRNAFGEEYYKIARKRVGVDPDKDALSENKLMDQKICCAIKDIYDISKIANSFDVVIAQWVLEHMDNPERDIRAISKLCKKDGHFIFMTTNVYSPVMLFSKICPTFLKKLLRKKMFGTDEDDTYPTKYRINSISKIDQVMRNNGFQKVDLKAVGTLGYFAFNKYILIGKIFLNKFCDKINFGSPFKTHLTGVYRKVE
ncbi:MAG: class I SAM-dependent methyltransferase [Candidatus Pacebacteria bacterium]|nr:class I SAM-dependent methyltransferase [Candidatus Paceibacterota bacterium]